MRGRRFKKRRVAPAVKRFVRKAITKRAEVKKFTVTWNNAINTSGSTSDVQLSGISQGDGNNERIGSTVKARSLWTRINITRGDDTYNVVRIILYSPKNSQVQYMTNDSVTTTSPLDYDKYKIWADKQVLLDADEHVQKIQFRHNLRGMVMRWSGDTGAVPLQGNLKMIMVSDSTTAPHPNADGYTTLTYTDS